MADRFLSHPPPFLTPPFTLGLSKHGFLSHLRKDWYYPRVQHNCTCAESHVTDVRRVGGGREIQLTSLENGVKCVCMYVYMYMCMYMCISVHVCVHVHAYSCAYMCACACTWECMCTCTVHVQYMGMYVYMYSACTCTFIYTCTHVCVCKHGCVYI
jgi:hypothetical protein